MAVVAGVVAWFVVAVAKPRLANQREIEGLAAPAGLDWNDPSHVDSMLTVLADLLVARPANAGISIGVTRNGRRHVVFRGVTSKDDHGTDVDDSTLFELGSVTKTFTGVALAQAVVDRQMSLDQPIAELLPASQQLPDAVRSITIGALATHTAGLSSNPPSVSFLASLFKKHPFGGVTDRDAFESLSQIQFEESVAREYNYSNFGFMLLGRLIEEGTGEGYARLIEDRVAGSLGMRHTWVAPPEAERARLATGHRVGHPVEHWYEFELPGASGVVSTVSDMLTYLEAHLHPEATPLAAAIRLAMEPRVRASDDVEVGLGWHIYTVPDVPQVVYHNGATMGFRSYVGMAPELDLGIVVLGNSRDPTINAIGRLIMRTLTGNEERGG
ncbi:MAG: serine hydrolase [Gemmatimonadales bacterium]